MGVEAKGKDPNSEASNSDSGDLDIRLGGNIVLVGFSLDPAEMIVTKKIIGNYAKKISENIEYKELKINLKKTQKAKSFSHEIKVDANLGGKTLLGEAVNNNLYTALSEAMDKVFEQALNMKK